MLDVAAGQRSHFGHHSSLNAQTTAAQNDRGVAPAMTLSLARNVAWVFAIVATAMPALAQQPRRPACIQLEAQLAAFDRGVNDPARAEQVRRLEETIAKQQSDLERNQASAKRIGCEGGFFLFGGRPPQCGPLNAQIQTQQTNVERLQANLQQLQSANSPEHEGQRRAILVALSQNDCGPQYRAAVTTSQPRGGLFDSLFGTNSVFTNPGPGADAPASGTYRTICVRTCDGFYYPISFAASPARFLADAQICARSCPAAEVALYAHRNPGEDVNQAFSTATQQPYTALPNAFKYRTSFDPLCNCRNPGETWANALKHVEDPIERGDVVVSEERAKQLSQPRFDANGKPIRPDPKAARPTTPVTGPAARPPASAATADAETPKPDPNRKVRSVGPTFIPR